MAEALPIAGSLKGRLPGCLTYLGQLSLKDSIRSHGCLSGSFAVGAFVCGTTSRALPNLVGRDLIPAARSLAEHLLPRRPLPFLGY